MKEGVDVEGLLRVPSRGPSWEDSTRLGGERNARTYAIAASKTKTKATKTASKKLIHT